MSRHTEPPQGLSMVPGTDCEGLILFLRTTIIDLKSHFSCKTERIRHNIWLQKEQACFDSGVAFCDINPEPGVHVEDYFSICRVTFKVTQLA